MTLTIYNTKTRSKELFAPMHPPHVSLYACGVTVYDNCHLGHGRTYTSIDVLTRYLTHLGYKVRYVRNITDIDDKIINRANERGIAWDALVSEQTKHMHNDFKALGLFTPSDEPCATTYIPNMITLISELLNKDHAYVGANGDVYFRVASLSSYGALSGHKLEDLESGARVAVSTAKEDAHDFVLWKLAKAGEPSWPSPFGDGRPGWHTECAAMSTDLLGTEFDIHAGGLDLLFPHHENELAQASALSSDGFARYWMHLGFLQIADEKMSKSLGNFLTIRDVLKRYDAEILRYLYVASHYRSPLIYTDEAMLKAKQSLTRLYTAVRYLDESVQAPKNTPFETAFLNAMNDDLNTPVALSILFDLAHDIQKKREHDLTEAAAYASLLRSLASVLGLLSKQTEAFFQTGTEFPVSDIERMINERNQARETRDWARADAIRKELLEEGIAIEDGASGTTWRKV